MIKLADIEWWYYLVGGAFSLYYAYRGFIGNKILFEQRNSDPNIKRKFEKWEYISVYCIGDAIFHFICSVVGFYAFRQAIYMLGNKPFDVGNSILIVFLFLFSVLGISGQLPQLILQGKLPWLSK
jgi:hypothetical protein